MQGITQIVVQLGVLLIFTVGGGGWLWLLTGSPPPGRGRAWVWFGLAGLALAGLFLQTLLYCGVPLRSSAWFVLGFAGTGWLLAWRSWRSRGRQGTAGMKGEIRALLLVFVLAVAGQAPALVILGPDRFYGFGTYDQANYVALGDLFADVPLSVKLEDIGYRPWLAPILEAKDQRITQSVLLGAVGVTTGTDSQTTYGAINLFFVALAGVVVAAWLRTMSLPRWVAAGAGLALAWSPALTRVHLEGYFSQTASLFVLPALAGILGAKGPLRRESKLNAAILLAYLLGTYTEVAVFGFGLSAVLVFARRGSWRSRGLDLAGMVAGALLFNPGYLTRLGNFIVLQGQAARNPAAYATLFPDSGTLAGWGRMFVDLPWPGLTATVGVFGMALAAWGAWCSFRLRRPALALAVGMAALALLAIRLRSEFAGYVFTKLEIQFAPILVAAGVAGLFFLLSRGPRMRRIGLGLIWLWAVAALLGAWPLQRRVIEPTGPLAELSSSHWLALRQETEQHPERAYLVANDDPVLTQWLCYFARKSDVAVERRTVGDRILPSEVYGCRRWLGPKDRLYWLDVVRTGQVSVYEPAPTLTVQGAQATGGAGKESYYVAGPALDFAFHRAATDEPRELWLDFAVIPWRSGTPCQLELTDSAGNRWALEVNSVGWCRWPLLVPPGESSYRLHLNSASTTAGEPVALVRSLSVEVSPALPGWQLMSSARRVGRTGN